MEEELISVIVPVFNVQSFLDRMMRSVVNQTYKNLEIILVNDGSTDISGDLCEKWKKKDNRVVVIHKENGGLSSARNEGIRNANGKYIGFVDSDDYIAEDMFETLHELLIMNKTDVARCGSVDVYNGKMVNLPSIPYDTYILNRDDFYIECMGEKRGNCVGVCNKLYKKEIFDDLLFREGLYVEDYYILPEIVSKIEKAVCTTKPGYFYQHRASGITGGMRNPLKHIEDRLLGCAHNEEYAVTRNDLVRKCVEEKNYSKYFVICRIAYLARIKHNSHVEECKKKLRKNKRVILDSQVLGKGIKRSYKIWLIFPQAYYVLYKQVEKRRYG